MRVIVVLFSLAVFDVMGVRSRENIDGRLREEAAELDGMYNCGGCRGRSGCALGECLRTYYASDYNLLPKAKEET